MQNSEVSPELEPAPEKIVEPTKPRTRQYIILKQIAFLAINRFESKRQATVNAYQSRRDAFLEKKSKARLRRLAMLRKKKHQQAGQDAHRQRITRRMRSFEAEARI